MIKLVLKTIFIISHRERTNAGWLVVLKRRSIPHHVFFIAYRAITSVIRCKNITIYYIKKKKREQKCGSSILYRRKVWMHDASRSRRRMRFLVETYSIYSREKTNSVHWLLKLNSTTERPKHDITSIYKWEFSNFFRVVFFSYC